MPWGSRQPPRTEICHGAPIMIARVPLDTLISLSVPIGSTVICLNDSIFINRVAHIEGQLEFPHYDSLRAPQ